MTDYTATVETSSIKLFCRQGRGRRSKLEPTPAYLVRYEKEGAMFVTNYTTYPLEAEAWAEIIRATGYCSAAKEHRDSPDAIWRRDVQERKS